MQLFVKLFLTKSIVGVSSVNGTHTEGWSGLGWRAGNKTPTMLVSGGSGTERKVMAQQGSISSL